MSYSRWLLPATLVASLAGCVSTQSLAPRRALERAGTQVNASFAKTWEAMVDLYGDANLPIRTIDRSSGLLVGERLSVNDSAAADTARYDCGGTTVKALGKASTVYTPATDVAYNVVVRGDSSRSTVKVSALWISVLSAERPGRRPLTRRVDCTTRGKWETDFEARVKERAEAKP